MRLIEQLRWWASECDRTNFGCQARNLLLEAAEAIEKLPAESLRPKGECKFCSKEDNGALCWDCSDLGISIEYRAGRIRVTNEYGDEAYLGVNFCPNCGADMRGETP